MIEVWTGLAPFGFAAVLAITLFASMVRGLTGFGLAIVLVPLLNMVMEPSRTVLLAVLVGTLAGFLGLKQAWANVDRPTTLTIALSGIVVSPIGLLLLFATPSAIGRLAIGAMAMLSLFILAMPRKSRPPPGRPAAIVVGIVSGLMGAFAAMPGPPAVWYYARSEVAPETMRDAMIVIFFAGPLAVAAMALAAGRIDVELTLLALATFPPLVVGNILGRRMFGVLPERIWRGLILGLVACSTAAAVLSG